MAEVDDTEEVVREESTVPAEKPSSLPLILILTALLIYFVFQSLQLIGERSNLIAVKGNQEAAIQEAQKVQGQFKILVGKTGELAEQGHAGAKMVMEELLSRGVSAAPQVAPPGSGLPPAVETKPAK